MNIGIIGTGRMGAAIASRLMGLGHSVTVWNRTAAKTKSLAEAGASVAATPAALASGSEIVISMLTDAAALEAAYEGRGGALSGEIGGKLFIEMSTVRPETERALAAKLRARGAAFVECPVGGTVAPAKEGKLFGFVGGEPADVAHAMPVISQLCRRVEHVGPVGAGASMKLAINLPLLVFWQSFSEALSLCKPLGLEPLRLVEIFADTSGGPNLLRGRGPVIAARLAGQGGPASFNVDSIRKDLRTMLAEAKGLGMTLPVAAQALECFNRASAAGLGDGDGGDMPAYWIARGGKAKKAAPKKKKPAAKKKKPAAKKKRAAKKKSSSNA